MPFVQAQVKWLESGHRVKMKIKKEMSQFSGHTLRLPTTGSVSIYAQVKPKNRFMKELLAGIMGENMPGIAICQTGNSDI